MRRVSVLGSLMVVAAVLTPGLAAADTTEAIAETGGNRLQLALPGVMLGVEVQLDEFGNIATVDVVDPAAAPLESDKEGPHRVRFQLDEDGTAVEVKAKKHKLQSKVKADGLDRLLGDHQWSAVLFPDASDVATTVGFTIAVTDGSPAITDVTVDGLTDSNSTTISGAAYDVAVESEDGESQARITFTLDGLTKEVRVKIEIEDDEDDEPRAVLKVVLKAKDRRRLQPESLDALIGARTWQGRLCDGTPVDVSYEIGPDGRIAVGAVSFDGMAADDGFTVKDRDNGFEIRFADSKARVKAKLTQRDDGSWQLKVDSKTTETCRHRDGDHEKKDDHRQRDGKKHKPEKKDEHELDEKKDDHEVDDEHEKKEENEESYEPADGDDD